MRVTCGLRGGMERRRLVVRQRRGASARARSQPRREDNTGLGGARDAEEARGRGPARGGGPRRDAGLVTPPACASTGEPCTLRRAPGADGKELSSPRTIAALLAVHIGGHARFG